MPSQDHMSTMYGNLYADVRELTHAAIRQGLDHHVVAATLMHAAREAAIDEQGFRLVLSEIAQHYGYRWLS